MPFDTHCHLNDEAFDDLNEIIANLDNDKVDCAVVVGYNMQSNQSALEISKMSDRLFCAVGFHPENVNEYNEGDFEVITQMAKDPKVVAIGEIGLDYHYEPFDKERQKLIFETQIELAKKLDLPIVVHQRDCGMDVLEILKKHRNELSGVVLHCFSESLELAKEFVKLNCYISFAGTLTFKNARGLLDVAKFVPKELILSETDCPYLAPQAHRGQRNQPKYVKYVVEKLAELRETSFDKMNQQIIENAKRVFSKIK